MNLCKIGLHSYIPVAKHTKDGKIVTEMHYYRECRKCGKIVTDVHAVWDGKDMVDVEPEGNEKE